MLTNLVENIIPIDYYGSMYGLLIEKKIFSNLVEFYLPEIFDKT